MEQEPGPEHSLTEKVIREVNKGKYSIDISKLDERSVVGLRLLIRELADETIFYRNSFKRNR